MGFIGRVVAISDLERSRTSTAAPTCGGLATARKRECTELTTSKVASSVQPRSCVTTPSSGIARSPFDLLWKVEPDWLGRNPPRTRAGARSGTPNPKVCQELTRNKFFLPGETERGERSDRLDDDGDLGCPASPRARETAFRSHWGATTAD